LTSLFFPKNSPPQLTPFIPWFFFDFFNWVGFTVFFNIFPDFGFFALFDEFLLTQNTNKSPFSRPSLLSSPFMSFSSFSV